jgi:hypothetical protein
MDLSCALCMYDPERGGPDGAAMGAAPADTIIGGFAVCETHAPYLSGWMSEHITRMNREARRA